MIVLSNAVLSMASIHWGTEWFTLHETGKVMQDADEVQRIARLSHWGEGEKVDASRKRSLVFRK